VVTFPYPVHSVIKLTPDWNLPCPPDACIVFYCSVRLCGALSPFGSGDLPNPTTTMRPELVVAATAVGEVFEFEDILFNNSDT